MSTPNPDDQVLSCLQSALGNLFPGLMLKVAGTHTTYLNHTMWLIHVHKSSLMSSITSSIPSWSKLFSLHPSKVLQCSFSEEGFTILLQWQPSHDPIIMKCFDHLVMQRIISILPSSMDHFQFAYQANQSTSDSISITFHSALTYQETQGLMLGCCSKTLFQYSTQSSFRSWYRNYTDWGCSRHCATGYWTALPGRSQPVQVGSTMTINMGDPRRCVVSPELFTLLTMTVHQNTAPKLWWVMSIIMICQTGGAKWAYWPHAAVTMIWTCNLGGVGSAVHGTTCFF